ncbi:D-ribose pyranase [Thermobrachium celere]|uniref:D-ribose pyranase n=1 Tax=Thermobrachium celere DSM 8682 TaxID=941824 RepID=R7RUF7_9CLOT|nr:D-ribose pyranase [Thermobrachium celere]CDF59018.1 Ribose ABC transport system, high affinity permease RbsD (TC 3.A.1.2.1) [Thermobrachium celere DSM 8682]
MKKIGILNHEISEVIAKMGHTDSIAIGDCGLPIPDNVRRIDLALVKNIPSFIDTLKAVLIELKVEEVVIAEETIKVSNFVYEQIEKEVGDVKITIVSHEELKEKLKDCKAVIRTGEQTPYANVILKSGVVF